MPSLPCSQGVAQQSAEAISVWLHDTDGQHGAQLRGFKSRALRSSQRAMTQRHLYATEWRSLDMVKPQREALLVISKENWIADFELLPPRVAPDKLATNADVSVGKVIVMRVATQRDSLALLPQGALEMTLTLVQTQAAIARRHALCLLMKGARRVEHAGLWGLARSARVEAPLPLTCFSGLPTASFTHGAMLVEPEMVSHAGVVLVLRLGRAPPIADLHMERHADAAHLVTGGTGGLGLLTARWLAQCKATRALALISRSGMIACCLRNTFFQLVSKDMPLHVQQCDTQEGAHIGRLLACITETAPVSGVWHAAGVLVDGVLQRQTADALARVYGPKTLGAWALYRSLLPAALQVFALFSSVAALFGGAGQANYSAANACLDTLASSRRAFARAATSIQWGAWAEVGMAARGAAAERMAAMEATSGLGRISLAQGLCALYVAVVLPQALPILSVFPAQWERMLSDLAVPTFLSRMVDRSCVSHTATAAVAQCNAHAVSLEAVLEVVQRTAGGAIQADAALMEAGIDSLGTVELRNELQRTVGDRVSLSSTLVFDHPTARRLAAFLGMAEEIVISEQGWAFPKAIASVDALRISGASSALPALCCGAANLWHAARTASDLVGVAPVERWGELVNGDGQVLPQDGAFLDDAELFDASFFRISPAEARVMDVQQRLLLEHSYCAVHGFSCMRTEIGRQGTGVYIGIWADARWQSVLELSVHAHSAYRLSAASCSMAAGRISYTLELRGPSLSVRVCQMHALWPVRADCLYWYCLQVDTACTAGSTACHMACGAVQLGECEVAIAAGVNLNFFPDLFAVMNGFKEHQGRCYSFDHRASG